MSITGFSNHHLIVMLYEQAIKFLHQTITDIREGNFAGRTRNIRKAQAIIDELNGEGFCESTGESGARTSWVLDQCVREYYRTSAGNFA